MTFPYPYPGPVAPYNNLPIEPQNYNPNIFFISTVALGVTTTVTTTVNHNYSIGSLIRLIIPVYSGCRQLNEQTGYVLLIPVPNQIVLSIDSSVNVDPFISTAMPTQPQTIAVGDTNTGQINAGRSGNRTFIQGSFINVS